MKLTAERIADFKSKLANGEYVLTKRGTDDLLDTVADLTQRLADTKGHLRFALLWLVNSPMRHPCVSTDEFVEWLKQLQAAKEASKDELQGPHENNQSR